MAWLGRINARGLHCLPCRRRFLRHAKLGVRLFHFLISGARMHTGIIIAAFPRVNYLLIVPTVSRRFQLSELLAGSFADTANGKIGERKFVCYRTARITSSTAASLELYTNAYHLVSPRGRSKGTSTKVPQVIRILNFERVRVLPTGKLRLSLIL